MGHKNCLGILDRPETFIALFNWVWSTGTVWCQRAWSTLIQIMVCHLPLPETVLTYCQLDPRSKNFSEIWIKIRRFSFSFSKMNLKILSTECPSFCLGVIQCVKIPYQKFSLLIGWLQFYQSWASRPVIMSHYESTQIAKFMGPTWGPPGSCRPQMGPMLAPWILLSGQWLIHCTVYILMCVCMFNHVTMNLWKNG